MLEQDISDIREKLQMWRRHYPSESAVSQSIVLRLLFTLGWPVYDTQVVYPEYTLEGRRVDFALCHPANEPRIFIEVKGVGKGTGAERQLFEYAFHRGVPLAILTDGREWSFFLPAEEGSYDKRLVCKLDLSASDAAESVQRFERYLRYDAVCSGAARKAAQADYRDVARARQIQDALPKAWAKLVTERDEFLLEVVAECVEGLCGYKPTSDTVARFLRETVQPGLGPLPPSAQPPVPSTPPAASEALPVTPLQPLTPTTSHPTAPEKAPEGMPASVGFLLFDEFYPCRNGREILVKVFEALAARDSTFNERFVALPRHGSKRRWLAQDPNGLHPGNPRRAQHGSYSHQLKSGYWLILQVDQKQRNRIIKQACEVAGISYGTDLKINDPPIRPRATPRPAAERRGSIGQEVAFPTPTASRRINAGRG